MTNDQHGATQGTFLDCWMMSHHTFKQRKVDDDLVNKEFAIEKWSCTLGFPIPHGDVNHS